MSALEKPIYRFDEFELDPGERRLLGHGKRITLTPKVFDTLVLLVERAGHAVSKDELMAALWPRGFVDESNLTKHIWLIRKVLNDNEAEARFIETVPKFGYRFIASIAQCVEPRRSGGAVATPEAAPVSSGPTTTAVERHSVSGANLPPERHPSSTGTARVVARSTRRRRIVGAAAATLAVFAVAIAVFVRRAAEPPSFPLDATGASIAVVDFDNLSHNAKDAWLDPAMTEMMANELTVGDTLHALPDELVRVARADLDAPLAGGYARQSLSILQKRLGVDYVLSGSYLISGANEEPEVRLDLSLQRPRDGVTIMTLSRSAPLTELLSLVTDMGAALRGKLGIVPTNPAELRALANVQPPTSEVARRIGFALDALRKYDPARARDELLDAVALAPGYAPAYAYLAQAWSALGYKTKALAAAQQAMAWLDPLPQDERLSIEAQLYAAQFDWPKAAEALGKLVTARPQDPSLRLRLISALLEGGRPDDARAALTELRTLPGMKDDPRVELAAAREASARTDPKGRAEHAERALQLALAHDNPGLAAQAREELGVADYDLGRFDQAERLHRDNIAYFQRAGNPHDEAFSHQALANAYSDHGNLAKAREEYQRAIALYQQIGDLAGQASSYDAISTMLWGAGDADSAKVAVRRALDLTRETGDLDRQAWNLNALATLESDDTASDEAGAQFREAIADARQIGKPASWYLSAYAGYLELRGKLDDAAAQCVQAKTDAGTSSDRQLVAYAESQCAAISLDQGDVDGAVAAYQRSLAAAGDIHDRYFEGVAELSLGQIDIGRRHWSSARDHLKKSIDAFTAIGETAGEANAQSLLALAYSAMEMHAERDQAAARAGELRAKVNQRQQVFVVDLALQQLRAEAGDVDAAVSALRSMSADAARRNWVSLSLEAGVAAHALLVQAGKNELADVLRADIDKTAQEHHFEWVRARLK